MNTEDGPATQIRAFQFIEDATAAAEILREAKEATQWTETDLLLLRDLSGASAYVSVGAGPITGIVIGRQMGEDAEILNLAVRRTERRKGAGKMLILRLLADYRDNSVSRVFLEVRESNKGAIRFYQGLGFRSVGSRKGYYPEPREDALVMELQMGKSTDQGR